MPRPSVPKILTGIFLSVALVAAYIWIQSGGSDVPVADFPESTRVPSSQQDPTGDADRGAFEMQPVASAPRQLKVLSPPAPAKEPHLLLKMAADAVLSDGIEELSSTASPELAATIRAVAGSGPAEGDVVPLKIDYPQEGSIFPPEMVPPTFLWHEPDERADTWLIDVALDDGSQHIYALCPGDPPPAGPIDPECITEGNQLYEPTPYQASAKSWTPTYDVWAMIKQRSRGAVASVSIAGFSNEDPDQVLSRGRIAITTSNDPVGGPIFYRDVPLIPSSKTERGVIKPLTGPAVTLIGWRLRDISNPQSRLVLNDVPRCTNCHSFSTDGTTLGMDLDGPQGDKGAYVIAPVKKQMVIGEKDVISWNSFPDKPEGHKTIGFLSRISPEGQYAVTTLNEEVFVTNFTDHKFLQVFFPTRGILGYYSRATGEMKALPGADDPDYVHCDPVWDPTGEYLVLARSEAKDAYAEGAELPTYSNDPAETQIQYDLYRMPFNEGRGGKPEPIAGASHNGMSNTFPKISPDGRWLVFVKCRNGQLIRPDSKLWIVPAGGGTARLMRCNTWRMNSWHSFSPNSRWLVFSSKANTPYTQMFLTHIDENGNDSPAILIPNSTAANRAVNLPEFVNIAYDDLVKIEIPMLKGLREAVRGIELANNGKLGEAMAHFNRALELDPGCFEAHLNLGRLLSKQSKFEEATDHFRAATEIHPQDPFTHFDLGSALIMRGMPAEGISHLHTALKLKPDYFDARVNLGRALLQQGMLEEATEHLRAVQEMYPTDAVAQFDVGSVLFARGMLDEAADHLRKSLEIDPTFINARLALGSALTTLRNYQAATLQFQEVIQIDPNNLPAVNELAWLLAVCPEDDVRNGAKAVQLAERACLATGYRVPRVMTTLSAAYAEVGRFSEAATVATKALDLLQPQQVSEAESIRRCLRSYQAGKPFRSVQ